MNSPSESAYLTYFKLDAFPCTHSRYGDAFSCAVIECCINNRMFNVSDGALDCVKERLYEEGWVVATVLGRRQVDEICDSPLAQQAEKDGFAANVRRVPIEHIVRSTEVVETDAVAQGERDFATAVQKQGYFYSLYSDLDEQYANGISANGQEFLPVWRSATSMNEWRCDFPGYDERIISLEKAVQWLLPELDTAGMLVAVSIKDDELVLMHPLNLKEMLGPSH